MSFEAELNELLREWDVSGLLAMEEGLYPYGMADRQAGRATCARDRYPLALDTPFLLALLCAKMLDKKALTLRSPLSRWLPELKGLTGIPTLGGLLAGRPMADCWEQHILPRLEKDPVFQGLSQAGQYLLFQQRRARGASLEDILPFLRENQPLPEDEPDFTMTHQVLLAEILRRASGKSLTRLAQEELFSPLGIQPASTPTTVGWGRYEDGPLVPQPPLDLPDIVCLTGTQAGALARAMAEQKLVSPEGWKTLLKSPVFSGSGALLSVGGGDLYGFDMSFYFIPGTGRWAVRCSNENQPLRLTPSGWMGFAYLLRQRLEAYLLPFTAPKLEKYCRKNWGRIYDLKLAPRQVTFVADPSEAICEAYVDRRKHPYLLTDRGKTVGMIVLRIDRKRDIYRVENLLISYPYQGRGYGKAMLELGLREMKRLGASRVTLEVERENTAARRLYAQAGFSVRRENEERFLLELTL